MIRKIFGFVSWLIVCFSASAIGALASVQAKSFYSQLIQPSWAPPPWVFGPVWTVLFTLMAVAAWLVWRSGGFRENYAALGLFLTQLAFNALWSWLFFAWHQGAFAFIDIVFLCVLISVIIAIFWRVCPIAGVLLIPYLLWSMFAACLNYSLWQLNPELLG